MNYLELKKQQSDELEAFPMFFAFNKTQFVAGMQKFGITDKGALCSIPGGGFIKKSDGESLGALLLKFSTDMEREMLDRDFLIGAIEYELSNHEFGYTLDEGPTLECLGLTLDTDMKKECFIIARGQALMTAC